MNLEQYISTINQRFRLGNATEHTFRGDLNQLLESILGRNIQVTNEPQRLRNVGAPDYSISKNGIVVGYIEAKDINDLDLYGKKKTGNKEQFDRYKASLPNIIFTDYLDFKLYRKGELITEVRIGEIENNTIKGITENYKSFENLVLDFPTYISQTIRNPKELATMMAGKARLLSDIIERSLVSDETNVADSTLKEQMAAFRQILIHDITPKAFADVYAQTIAYGMFAARLHDPTLDTFSRQEAAELIPRSNPFLRILFGYIAGPNIDDRIRWVVDSLADVFLACNVETILKDYGKATKMEDPIIHFYETFLSEYDPALKKARGVWYTPAPVVNFIVRAVDYILKSEFGLAEGLADTSKTKIKVKEIRKATADQRSKVKEVLAEKEVHKVQILDPATGTGTFLAEVVKQIYRKFEGMQGIWSDYAERDLLPRLNGFEILMASYAMAHLKMDLLLRETGFEAKNNQRFRIFLTNSLEESHPDTGTLWANWLSSEANEANRVKRDTPVMCILGNPPYNGESKNKGRWIEKLMEDYKKEPGGKEKLKERNPKWINDDYVKFLRYGQYFIEKNGSGVLAFINPHGFLDNPTFRGMRWNLLGTYDKIYTIDLHGNSKKKETAPDGSIDQNVFDIMQGVSINIFVKTGRKKNNELSKVFNYDLYGKRKEKYDFLLENTLENIAWTELQLSAPNYYFVNKNFDEQANYEKGFSVNNIFPLNNVGVVTSKDSILIKDEKDELTNSIENFYNITANNELIKPISYRPFDNKFLYYDTNLIERPRKNVMHHFLDKKNIGLVVARQCASDWRYVFITKFINEFNLTGTAGRFGSGNILPLYLYPISSEKTKAEGLAERIPNLNIEIVEKIAIGLQLQFTDEKETDEHTFAPIDILDYIYAVLHSPSYREKYKEFLKIDFPRVPYPTDFKSFWQLVALGGKLRQIHLLEDPIVNTPITKYPIGGDNIVDKIRFESYLYENTLPGEEYPDYLGVVYINEKQYFADVPMSAWDFYIGGYQPAQKWLKDRKGRKLEFEDIKHYQKIIVALTETEKLMKEIDTIEL